MAINQNSSVNELINAIESAQRASEIIEVINHPKADDTVLNKAIAQANLSFGLGGQSHTAVLDKVLDSDKVTSYILINVIKSCSDTGSVKVLTKAIDHPQTDKTILNKIIDQVNSSYKCGAQAHTAVLDKVLDSDKVTPDILISVIKSCSDTGSAGILIKAINHPQADDSVLNKAIDQVNSSYKCGGQSHTAVLDKVLNSDKVTPYILISVINSCSDTGSLGVLIKAISHSKVNDTVLNKAINHVDSSYKGGGQAHTIVLDKVLDSNKVTPNILINVINICSDTGSAGILIKAINHPQANDTVFNKAIDKANSSFSFSGQTHVSVINAVNAVRAKKVVIVNRSSPQPPRVNMPVSSAKPQQPVSNQQENGNTIPEQGVDNMSNEDNAGEINKMKVDFKIEVEDSVTDRIRRNVEDGMSTMLWGLSGIGKTARVRQIDPTFTAIKLKNDMLPEEVTGGKEPNGAPGEMYPPKWYVKLCQKCKNEPDKMHILFIDELTNVKNNIKSLVWDIIEDRRVNGDEDWQLPENCAIVAAGNRPEESTAVITDYNGGVLPEPLHDRFDFHIEIPLDMREWQQWAMETNPKTGCLNIHPVVLSYCVGHADDVMFSSLNMKDVTQPRLSPRRWEKLSKAINMAEKRGGKSCHVSNQRIAECIGTETASGFIAHYEKLPIDMDKVENGGYRPDDFSNIDDKLFAISSIITYQPKSEMAVIDFIETCLGEEYMAIYNVMRKQREETLLDITTPNSEVIEGAIRR